MDKEESKDPSILDEVSEAKESSEPKSPSKPEAGETPPSGMLLGYTQTYLVRKNNQGGAGSSDSEGKDSDDVGEYEVLFRCGNWCYTGHVMLKHEITLSDTPLIIPVLQRQQSRLHYYCNADGIPPQSNFSRPIDLVYEASDYAAATLASDNVNKELSAWANIHSWVEDTAGTFFEMTSNRSAMPSYMEDIALVCSKTYARGLVFITIYFEGSFYFTVADGEGDQPLLDVKFPDISHHGQAIKIVGQPQGYVAPEWFSGLSIWHSLPHVIKVPPPTTRNLSSQNYMQMYMIMKPREENGGFPVTSAYREVLFRFGSWCYGGSVQLAPVISLADIPHVIPALRMQQSRLEFVYAADQVPSTSPYAKPMAYMMKHSPLMEREISCAEDVLTKLLERLSAMGLGESINTWLEGDSSQSFFEFHLSISDEEARVLEPVELIAVKSYYASGIVLVLIYFGGSFFAVVSDAGAEQPLLDSKFPDVSNKGRGYQINSYGDGAVGWPGLRKVSIWQTTAAMAKEMEERLGKEKAAEVVGAVGTLATSAAVDAMERASEGSHNSNSNSNSETKDMDDRDVAPSKDEPSDTGSGSGQENKAAAAESKGGNESSSDSGGGHGGGIGDSERMNRQSLGAFHRLKPMASMESQLAKIRGTMPEGASAPWENDGRPRSLGKGLGSPFGKGLDFKKGPGPGGL